MRVLITGVHGFIAQNLAKALIERHHEVVGCGRQLECSFKGLAAYHAVDVLDGEAVARAMVDCAAVVHLAALTAHKDIVDDRFGALDINLRGTRNVLEAVRATASVRKLVFSSTGKVYGNFTRLPIDEDEPPRALNVLGKSKYLAERLIDFYAMGEERSYISLRIFNVYGPGQSENFLVPTILRQLDLATEAGPQSVSLGDVRASRDYTHIDDVVDAFVRVVEGVGASGFAVYNVASRVPTSAEDIVGEIAAILGVSIAIESKVTQVRLDELDEEYGDFARIAVEYGWRPTIPLTKGLRNTIEAKRCRR